ncbi:hypothetical protein LCGC14_2882780, partial [marine sediment metagenome]
LLSFNYDTVSSLAGKMLGHWGQTVGRRQKREARQKKLFQNVE